MEEQNQPKPDNHLALAIITTILCCLPLGVVGIVYASKVDGLYFTKNYEAARNASRSARNWSIAGIIVSLVGAFLYLIFWLFFGLMAAGLGHMH